MTKKVNEYKDAEQLAEELMMAFGKELGEARANFCEALMDPNVPDPPMFLEGDDDDDWELPPAADFDWYEVEPWTQVQTNTRKGTSSKRLRRVVILAAVIAVVMGMALIAADGIKLKESTMKMRETPNESTFLIDSDQAIYDVEDFVVTYVPEGYEMVEDELVGDIIRKIGYFDEAGNGIWIKISKTDHFGANVDNERLGSTEVLVNDKQAYVFVSGHTNMIVWQMGDCTIDIISKIPEEELIEIARQIYVK